MFENEVLLARWWFGENLDGASDGALIKRNALWDVAYSERECQGTESSFSAQIVERRRSVFVGKFTTSQLDTIGNPFIQL